MPKIYTTGKDRQKAYISRLIKAKRDYLGIDNKQIGDALGISERAVRYKFKDGNISLVDLWELRHVMPFSMEELQLLIGGERK